MPLQANRYAIGTGLNQQIHRCYAEIAAWMQQKWHLCLFVLTLLYIAPVWLFHYFPSQDGPSHIVNAQIIKEFHQESRIFDQVYRLNIKPFPNWATHVWMVGWQYIVPPLVVEKLLLSLYIVLMPLSFWYLLSAAGHRQPLYVLLVFPFIYHFCLFMGFYNFSLALPLFMLSLGFWWRYHDQWTWKRVVLLNLCLGMTYFAHLLPYLLFYVIVPLLALACLRTRWRLWLMNFLVVLPASLLGIQYLYSSGFLSSPRPPNNLANYARLLQALSWLDGLVSFDMVSEKRLGRALVVLILIAVLLGLGCRVWRRYRKEAPFWEKRDYFLLPFLTTLALYLYLPDGIERQGGLVTARMNLLTGLLIVPWLKDDIWKLARWAMTGLILTFVLVNWGYFVHRMYLFQTDLREYTAGMDLMEENQIVMPLIFDKTGVHSQRVQVFTHAMNYYCLGNGNVNLGNYEAEQHYFPVNFREGFQRPTVSQVHYTPQEIDFAACARYVTYIVAFGENADVLQRVESHYQLIRHVGRLRVYRAGGVHSKTDPQQQG